jgi:hypothetical protein
MRTMDDPRVAIEWESPPIKSEPLLEPKGIKRTRTKIMNIPKLTSAIVLAPIYVGTRLIHKNEEIPQDLPIEIERKLQRNPPGNTKLSRKIRLGNSKVSHLSK